jgi:hypothetical protein
VTPLNSKIFTNVSKGFIASIFREKELAKQPVKRKQQALLPDTWSLLVAFSFAYSSTLAVVVLISF